MFTWAKDLLSPSVQTGKPVSAGDSRKKSKDNEGEVTEDGFVCIGKSSFFQSPEMPALPYNHAMNPINQQHQQQSSSQSTPYPPNMANAGPATLYPLLPHQIPSTANSLMGINDNSELVRRIPFNLRSGLSTSGSATGQRHQKPFEIYLTQFQTQFRDKYEYDFSFERGVVREMSQQSPGCY